MGSVDVDHRTMDTDTRRAPSWWRPATGTLGAATGLYIAGFLVHNADHVRRGLDATSTHVVWAGNVGLVVAVTAILLVVTGHRLGPLTAAVSGSVLAAGYLAVHIAPEWSAFSDSFTSGDPDAFSWFAAWLEIAGALAFGAAGLSARRRQPSSNDSVNTGSATP